MNKFAHFFLLSLLLLTSAVAARAQTPVTTLESMLIDFWPDYDQPNVLILLTGTLPSGTTLPAEVTIPLPEGAIVNVVARISAAGEMIDDVVYTTEGDQLRMTIPESRFRVEYYVPYAVDGDTRSYTFTWLSSTSVNAMSTAVQQPVAATGMVTQPTAVNVTPNSSDGFTYHTLPDQAVPGGQPFTASFSYTMTNPQLSVENPPIPSSSLLPNTTAASAPLPSATDTGGSSINWLLYLSVAAIVIAAVALTWVIATQRTTSNSKVRKPQAARPQTARPQAAKSAGSKGTKSGAKRFCHECGNPLSTHDQFCRNCGTAVKKN